MWIGPTYQTYYQQLEKLVRDRLAKEGPAYLLQVDFDQYLDYLESEFKPEPLEWDEGGMTVESFFVRREHRDALDRKIVVDEQRLRLRIPISPNSERDTYFKLGPSTTMETEPEWKFENNVLIYEVEATDQAVHRGLEAVQFWLGNRNKDIEAGNKNLRQRIRQVWERKRKQLEEQDGATQSLLQKLNIPLHQDPKARAKPIAIKPRDLRTVIEKPKATATPQPTLNREDVLGLVDFIDQYTRQFEVTPKFYAERGEEELRDVLIGMMNTNYPGTTTAETFSKLGKTDISFQLDSGHVLICECKFWSGAKAYGEAIGQLFGYLTWRQNYGVLIHFCKLKDMSRAVSETKRATREHASFTVGTLHEQSETRFISRHLHPQDPGKSVEVHHLFVDLSI